MRLCVSAEPCHQLRCSAGHILHCVWCLRWLIAAVAAAAPVLSRCLPLRPRTLACWAPPTATCPGWWSRSCRCAAQLYDQQLRGCGVELMVVALMQNFLQLCVGVTALTPTCPGSSSCRQVQCRACEWLAECVAVGSVQPLTFRLFDSHALTRASSACDSRL
jgi:hypothetical protein